jgi:hypothetical protein
MKSYKILRFLLSMLVLVVLCAGLANGADPAHILAAVVVPPVITGPDGDDNPGGFKNFVIFIPDGIISKEPTLLEKPDKFTDYVEASGKFEFNANGLPIYCYSTPGTVDFKPGTQGEIDGRSFNQKGEWFHPHASKSEVMSLARYLNNRAGRIVIETIDGVQLMIGQEGLPATISASGDYGKAAKDQRGFKFEFVTDSFVPAIVLPTASRLDIKAIKNGGNGLVVAVA